MHRLRGIASDVHEEHTPEGVIFEARLPAAETARHARFRLDPDIPDEDGRTSQRRTKTMTSKPAQRPTRPATMPDAGLPVPVKLLSPAARLPERAYDHDAAWDLCAAEEAVVRPLARAVVGTGIALGLPSHLAALTLPRSGLAARSGISIVNSPGLIDPGYRGEVRVILLNTDPRPRSPSRPATASHNCCSCRSLTLTLVAVRCARRHAPRRARLRLERNGGEVTMADAAPEQAPAPSTRRPPTSSRDEKPTIRVAGLLVHEGSILMVEQGRGDERYWLLPGGGVQFGETLSDALRRELQEELGLRVGVQRLVAIVESISPEPDYAKHVIHLIFEISAPAEALPEPQDVKVLNARFLERVRAPVRRRSSAHHRVPERVREGDALVASVSRPALVAVSGCSSPERPSARCAAREEHAIISVM